MKTKLTSVERRKNKVTFYYANGIGCPQPAFIIKEYFSTDDAKQAAKAEYLEDIPEEQQLPF